MLRSTWQSGFPWYGAAFIAASASPAIGAVTFPVLSLGVGLVAVLAPKPDADSFEQPPAEAAPVLNTRAEIRSCKEKLVLRDNKKDHLKIEFTEAYARMGVRPHGSRSVPAAQEKRVVRN